MRGPGFTVACGDGFVCTVCYHGRTDYEDIRHKTRQHKARCFCPDPIPAQTLGRPVCVRTRTGRPCKMQSLTVQWPLNHPRASARLSFHSILPALARGWMQHASQLPVHRLLRKKPACNFTTVFHLRLMPNLAFRPITQEVEMDLQAQLREIRRMRKRARRWHEERSA